MFETCPCGSGKGYLACCGPLHGGRPAPSAEALMRARYSAFVRGDVGFLHRSWAAETRPAAVDLEPGREWTGLTVHGAEADGPDAATVRFTARWRLGGKAGKLRETSRFRRDGAGWVYVGGEVS